MFHEEYNRDDPYLVANLVAMGHALSKWKRKKGEPKNREQSESGFVTRDMSAYIQSASKEIDAWDSDDSYNIHDSDKMLSPWWDHRSRPVFQSAKAARLAAAKASFTNYERLTGIIPLAPPLRPDPTQSSILFLETPRRRILDAQNSIISTSCPPVNARDGYLSAGSLSLQAELEVSRRLALSLPDVKEMPVARLLELHAPSVVSRLLFKNGPPLDERYLFYRRTIYPFKGSQDPDFNFHMSILDDLFKRSELNRKIRKVEVIVNSTATAKYDQMRDLFDKLNKDTRDVYLCHGTPKHNIQPYLPLNTTNLEYVSEVSKLEGSMTTPSGRAARTYISI